MIEKVTCISITGSNKFQHLQQIGLFVLLGRPLLLLSTQKNLQTADLVLGFKIKLILAQFLVLPPHFFCFHCLILLRNH